MKIEKRPWGDFKEFVKNKECTVKILEIEKNQSLSLQYHNHRREVWYFLTDGWVQLRSNVKKIKSGQLVRVPKKQLHRIFSKDSPVRVLEISYGKFDENDEIRLEDKYGRV